MAGSTYPSFAAGQKLTAALLNSALPMTATKATDQSMSSTTLTDDTDLQFTVAASAVYEVSGLLGMTGDQTNDLKVQFAFPTGSTFDWTGLGPILTATTTSGSVPLDRHFTTDGTWGVGMITGSVMTLRPNGLLRTSTTAGTFKLQFAQQGSSATAAVMKADSYLVVRRVA